MADAIGSIGETAVGFGDQMNDAFGLTKIFDPNKDERKKAEGYDAQARALWLQTLPKDANGNPIISAYDAEQFGLDAPAIGYGPDDLRRFGEGSPAFMGSTAEWGDAGPTAYDSMGYDAKALSGMDASQDYFASLVSGGGKDAASEAEYARRTEQAERARRGEADAAVRAFETQGRGGSGATLLANLTSAQGQASDQYQAGLDANAMAQGRRDNASAQSANVAQARGQYTAGVDQAKATGQDAWNSWTHEGAYNARDKDADRDQTARKAMWDRQNTTNDANTAMHNERAWWQGPGKGQEMWNRQQGSVAGATGAYNTSADGLRSEGGKQPSPFGDIMNIIKGVGGGMGG